MGLFDSSQTTQNAPWKPAQPYVKAGMKQAKTLLDSKAGFRPAPFQTWTPMSSQTKTALGGMWGAAQGANPLAAQSMGAISGILGGATNDKYNSLYDNSSNQAFEQNVQNQSNHIADDVQRQFSGMGRIGSAADTGALVNQLGEYRTKAMADNWNQNIANQRGILGDQTTGQLNAVGAAPGAYDQQFAPYRIQAQVGSAYDDLATRQKQAQLDKFQARQQQGWNRLGAYQGAIAGGGPQGTGQSTVTTPFDWAGAIGSGVKAASLFAGL